MYALARLPRNSATPAMSSVLPLRRIGVWLIVRSTISSLRPAVIFDGILNRDPAPASSFNPAISNELDRIIAKALEKDRALRYQTAADLRALVHYIDVFTEHSGRLLAWLVVAMALLTTVIVVMRYGFDVGSIMTQASWSAVRTASMPPA